MRFSKHAMTRTQQRGIPYEIAELVLFFGKAQRKQGDAKEYRIKKRDVGKYICRLKYLIHSLEKAKNKAVLVDGKEDVIITLYGSY